LRAAAQEWRRDHRLLKHATVSDATNYGPDKLLLVPDKHVFIPHSDSEPIFVVGYKAAGYEAFFPSARNWISKRVKIGGKPM
jgi:hypothetical protein